MITCKGRPWLTSSKQLRAKDNCDSQMDNGKGQKNAYGEILGRGWGILCTSVFMIANMTWTFWEIAKNYQ